MIELRKKALDMLFALKAQGVDKAECTVTYNSMDETNSLGHEEYLLREHESCDMDIKVFKCGKMAQQSINQFSPEAILAVVKLITKQAECSPGPSEDQKLAYSGHLRSDMFTATPRDSVKLYSRFEEMMASIKKGYPLISMDGMARWEETKVLYINTDGQELSFTEQEAFCGWQASARNNTCTTDCVFCHIPIESYDVPFLDCGDMREQLALAEKMLNPRTLSGEAFSGTLVLTPEASNSYSYELMQRIENMEAGDGFPSPNCSDTISLYDAYSDTKYTAGSGPMNSSAAKVRFLIKDGNAAPKETAGMSEIEEALYIAQKSKDVKDLNYHVMGIVPGNTQLADLIKNVKRGLLIGYINGSMPSPSGDFSGTAKNSFYIENGEIKYPVIETMVMGNVFNLFKHVVGVSSETKAKQRSNFPWIAVDGAIIK